MLAAVMAATALFRVIHTLLVFVGLHMSTEIHSMTCIFRLFRNIGDSLHPLSTIKKNDHKKL